MAVGTVTLTRDILVNYGYNDRRNVREIQVDFVASSSDGSLPVLSLTNLYGYVLKVITNPGSTAPTDNWDILLGDPEDNALDALALAVKDRDTATTEAVYPVVSGAATPVWLAKGDYALTITGNSVNSATGRILIYLTDSL